MLPRLVDCGEETQGERSTRMKRALTVAAVLVFAGFAAATATAHRLGTIALDDHPNLVAPATITLDVNVTDNQDYEVWEYQGAGCTGEPVDSQDGTGTSFSVTFEDLAAGTWSFNTTEDEEDNPVVTNCLDVTIAAPGAGPTVALVPQVDNAFLCYSVDQTNPGVWPMAVARQLLAGGGYWTPYAVQGNVDGGTNIGGFHLACNLASTQSVSTSTLGGAGETDGPNAKADVTNTAGYYPIVGA
jgi:hypothetical protein